MPQSWEAQLAQLREADVIVHLKWSITGWTASALDAGRAFATIMEDQPFGGSPSDFTQAVAGVHREWLAYERMRGEAA